MTKTLARASSQLAGLSRRTRGEALHGQVVQLQRTLKQASAQLTTTEAGLHTPLAVADAQVRREVEYVQGGVHYSRAQLIAEAALDYVAGHVSDTAYGYLELSHARLPSALANQALSTQAGICTGAAVTFATIVHHFGLTVRSVNFYYDDPAPENTPDGHVAVEVRYGGDWHFFDPTYGQFWTDSSGNVLSLSDVRAGKGTEQKNVAAFTNVFEDAVYGNDAWFITDPTTRIAYYATKLTGLGG
jgi:Transglutaminase-like superfamily